MVRALPAAAMVCTIIIAACVVGLQEFRDAQADTPDTMAARPITYMGQTILPYDPLP